MILVMITDGKTKATSRFRYYSISVMELSHLGEKDRVIDNVVISGE